MDCAAGHEVEHSHEAGPEKGTYIKPQDDDYFEILTTQKITLTKDAPAIVNECLDDGWECV